MMTTATGKVLDKGQVGDKFGSAVDVDGSGTTIVVGAPGRNGNTGGVYVYRQPFGGWTGTLSNPEELPNPAPQPGAELGGSVSISNVGTILAGAPGADVGAATDAGTVGVYRAPSPGAPYAQAAQLTHAAPQPGSRFGAAVDIDGPTLLVGEPLRDVGGDIDQGAMTVFRDTPTPTRVAEVTPANGTVGDKFGSAVDATDDVIGGGAPGRDASGRPDTGAGYVFERDASGMPSAPTELVDPQAAPGAGLGSSMSVDRDGALAGQPGNAVGSSEDQGSVAAFENTAGWTGGQQPPTGRVLDVEGLAGDAFGSALDRDENGAVVGAPLSDGGTVAARGKTLQPDQGLASSYANDTPLFADGFDPPRDTLIACASPRLAIPDNTSPSGIFSDIVVSDPGARPIRDVNVRLNITHTWVGDLRVRLEHLASGRGVTLLGGDLICGSNNIAASVDDEGRSGAARTRCNAAPPAINGSVAPLEWLQAFDGAAASGNWRLTVADGFLGDVGTLDSWCVEIRR